VKKIADMFIRFDRIHERDGQTDRQTDAAWQNRPRLHSIARQKSRFTTKILLYLGNDTI